jgi:hypothetical protein
MARRILALVAILALIVGSAVPAHAAGRGGGHRGGGYAAHRGGGQWHGGHGRHGHWSGRHGHHGGWWAGAFVGGFALGAALAYPYAYPYPAYAYAYPGYAYPGYPYPYSAYPYAYYPYASAYPAYRAQVTSQPAAVAPQRQVAVQREVVYAHGKYVLRGDGVTQAWQWVWVPAVPASPGLARATSP